MEPLVSRPSTPPPVIGELGQPTKPKPGPRRAGGLFARMLGPGLDARLVQAHGPLDAVTEAFMLGQRLGHGRMGDLLGCARCAAKSVATLDGQRVCLLCGGG
jgi:hypothetical protein